MDRKLQGSINYNTGLWAEIYAELYLRAKGYRILERRYKTKFGEVDIIARKSGSLVFVEVKKRKNIDAALFCVTSKMKKRIKDASMVYILKNRMSMDTAMRFDLIAVVGLKIKQFNNVM